MVFLPRRGAAATLALATLFSAGHAAADPPVQHKEPYIVLLTIGPGDPLWTRFGHTALMVMREHRGTKGYDSRVYNYGAADFGASGFAWRFFRGTSRFFVAMTGTFNDTVNAYAASNRGVRYQKLNLTAEQVQRVIARLEHDAKPENREYPYHHLTSGCATKVRDLLDEVVGGAIRRQLGTRPDPHTPRHYGRLAFAGDFWAEIASDLFMGRLHDRPQTRYFALYMPRLLLEYLQRVKVPDPAASPRSGPQGREDREPAGAKGLVPLAGPPSLLVDRRGAPPTAGQGRTLIHLTYLFLGYMLVLGILAVIGGARHPRRAGIWLLTWSVPMGIAAGMMVFGALASTVAEGRINELMLSFPVTDMALIWIGIRWVRGRVVSSRLLRAYALIRLLMVVAVLTAHAPGLLVQQPRIVVVLALVCTLLLNLVLRRLPAPSTDPTQPALPGE